MLSQRLDRKGSNYLTPTAAVGVAQTCFPRSAAFRCPSEPNGARATFDPSILARQSEKISDIFFNEMSTELFCYWELRRVRRSTFRRDAPPSRNNPAQCPSLKARPNQAQATVRGCGFL